MTSRHWLLLSGAAVLAGSLIGPHIVPLYDGVGFPDEPYRYVDQTNAPANASVLSPSSASGTFSISDLNGGVKISTSETGPQFLLLLSPGAVSLPKGADALALKATPITPSDQPGPGAIAGNAYEVTATTQSGNPKFDSTEGQLYLRLPQGVQVTGTVAIVYRTPGGKWQSQFTAQTGNDIYEVAFKGPGDYAMATGVPLADASPTQKTSPNASPTKSGSVSRYVLVGVFLLILALNFLAIRRLAPGSRPKENHDYTRSTKD